MSNINIRRTIENIRSGTNIYTPVIELIVNSIQAIPPKKAKNGLVQVTILRSKQCELGSLAAIEGFSVEDNGVGFDQKNRNSFDTLYSDFKVTEGGKGFGRFTCLKYFASLHVKSVFKQDKELKQRSFDMGIDEDIIIHEKVTETSQKKTGSVVTISGIKSVKFPDKGIDVVARILVERLLPYFIDKKFKCPRIVIKDGNSDEERVLNEYLSSDRRQIIEMTGHPSDIALPGVDQEETFNVRVFKFYAPKTTNSKVCLVAHRREVTETPLHSYIPEFQDEFYDKAQEEGSPDRNYIIKAYVFGKYLDDNVSLERGTFNFPKESDFLHAITQAQIEATAANIAKEAVGVEISERKERKTGRIKSYIEERAPWHRTLSQEVDFSSLPMHPSDEEIELHLQSNKFKIEIKARAAVKEIITSTSSDELNAKASQAVELISLSNKSDLIHYVALRRCVLELFSKSLEKDENGKYKSEGAVHDIIIPRGKDTDELDYAAHNLWILDERLNFSSYACSDKPLAGAGSDRTDITVFNRPVAFRGENEPSNPVTIFEFKRPQRDDFANPSSQEDPIEQIIRYVNQIHDGKCALPNGRTVRVSDNTPFYGYVVCDLTSKVKDWLKRTKNFTEMPDALGWFNWYGNIRLYIEVLSWDKVLADAEMRNRIFFDKLGI